MRNHRTKKVIKFSNLLDSSSVFMTMCTFIDEGVLHTVRCHQLYIFTQLLWTIQAAYQQVSQLDWIIVFQINT